jgi:hypothetical protein
LKRAGCGDGVLSDRPASSGLRGARGLKHDGRDARGLDRFHLQVACSRVEARAGTSGRSPCRTSHGLRCSRVEAGQVKRRQVSDHHSSVFTMGSHGGITKADGRASLFLSRVEARGGEGGDDRGLKTAVRGWIARGLSFGERSWVEARTRAGATPLARELKRLRCLGEPTRHLRIRHPAMVTTCVEARRCSCRTRVDVRGSKPRARRVLWQHGDELTKVVRVDTSFR